jgi:hypothetical protein
MSQCKRMIHEKNISVEEATPRKLLLKITAFCAES